MHYRVRRTDLASKHYPKKPDVIATARLLWLCEWVVMPAIPGVSLGVEMSVEHLAPAVRGTRLTVIAVCVGRHGPYWDWAVEVRDGDVAPRRSILDWLVWLFGRNRPDWLAWLLDRIRPAPAPAAAPAHKVIALCALRFVADIDLQRYQRRLAPQLAARTINVRAWLCILDAFRLISLVVLPMQMAYVWQHGWISRLATETVLVAGWLVSLTGLWAAIRNWATVRRVIPAADEVKQFSYMREAQ